MSELYKELNELDARIAELELRRTHVVNRIDATRSDSGRVTEVSSSVVSFPVIAYQAAPRYAMSRNL